MASAGDSNVAPVTSRIYYEYDQYPQESHEPITFGVHLETTSALVIENPAASNSPALPKHKIVFVLDTSRSMDVNIKLLKQIMHKVISLSIGNSIGIVAFNSVVDILCPMTKLVSESDVESMKQKISKLSTSGYTNICDGILTGMDVLWSDVVSSSSSSSSSPLQPPQSMRSVAADFQQTCEKTNEFNNKNITNSSSRRFLVLLTDGEANTGCTEFKKIHSELSNCPYISATDIYAIALGNDVNQDLLHQLSTSYSGKLYSVENSRQLWASFGDCLGSIMSTFIRDLTITIRFNSNFDISTDYPNISKTASTLTTQVGTLFLNDSRDFLFTLQATSDLSSLSTNPSSSPLATIEIAYVDNISGKQSSISHVVHPNVTTTQTLQGRNPEIRKQQMRIEVSKFTADWSEQSQEMLGRIALEIQAEQWQNDPFCSELLSAIRLAPSIPHIGRRSLSVELATQRHTGDYSFEPQENVEKDLNMDGVVSIGRELGVSSLPTADVVIFTQLSQSSSQNFSLSQSSRCSDDHHHHQQQTTPSSSSLKRTSSQVGFCE